MKSTFKSQGRMVMKIFITGGSGFVGTTLTRQLVNKGHHVTILTRHPETQTKPVTGVSFLAGDPNAPGPWQGAVAGHDLLINLAGASIFTRWTAASKQIIRDSRINSTHHLVDALEMASAPERPKTLLSTSAVGYYGAHGDEVLSEESPAGNDFLAQVARGWEGEAQRATKFGARVVCCRFGIVLGRKGGALSKMQPIFKLGLGSPLGDGNQWFSWIHEHDLAGIFSFLVDNQEISGPVNCVAHNPVTNAELSRELARQFGKKMFPVKVPAVVLKAVLGEMSSILLDGQRAYPNRLTAAGYQFKFGDLATALQSLMATG